MDIRETLTDLDLSPREADVYVALLELGQGTPVTIAKKTGLKRTTIYLDLESLRRKQLVGLLPHGKKNVYVPHPPSQLLRRAQQQERAVHELLPHLRALENTGSTKPIIRFYDDVKDIERVWNKECYQAKENYYISDYTDTLQLFPELEQRAQDQLRRGVIKVMKEVHPDTPAARKMCESYPKQVGRECRFLPKGMKFPIDVSIWDSTVAIYSNPKRYMLVITDEAIAESYRTMFESLWLISKK